MQASVSDYILYAIRATCSQGSRAPADSSNYVAFHLPDTEWEVWDYFPSMCRHLRQLHGIEDADYVDSWTVPPEMVKPTTGAGRSGSLFQKSRDGRYILKTLPEGEFSTLEGVFPGLYDHLVRHENSLITPIFTALKLSGPNGETYWLACSLNVVDFAPLTSALPNFFINFTVYDLKGRDPKPGHYEHVEDGVVKDKNLERDFFVPEELLQSLLGQLEADVGLLNSQNLMDYSLLVGLVLRTPHTANPLETWPGWPWEGSTRNLHRSAFRCFYGGFPGDRQCSEVYFVGIIDFLTYYGKFKMAANMLKSVLWFPETLSTVPADDYASRFMTFFRSCILPAPSNPSPPEWAVASERDIKLSGSLVSVPSSTDAPSPSQGRVWAASLPTEQSGPLPEAGHGAEPPPENYEYWPSGTQVQEAPQVPVGVQPQWGGGRSEGQVVAEEVPRQGLLMEFLETITDGRPAPPPQNYPWQ
eukprot:RCo012549